MQEILHMSKKELHRHSILTQVINKQLTQRKASEILDISDRQLRNLLVKYKRDGEKGLISKKRGKPSNRSYNSEFKKQVMSLVRERYPDFGPTFATEKLFEYHNLKISNETLRKWMSQEHLWIPRKKQSRIHPSRPRCEYFGEIIQIDGSHHPWFEDRNDKCVLIVFIDDATSKITSLHFCPSECLDGYFKALTAHLLKFGRPIYLYSDRHSIFGGGANMDNAQFKRAIKELEIRNLLARSPQAKGRVERVNRTLQDRLVKEMRLRNISNIEDANKFLPEFIERFNKKFSKKPRGQFDAHRPLDSGFNLERILARNEERTLSKDLSFSFNSTFYQITETSFANRLRNRKIKVVLNPSTGTFKVFYEGKELKYVRAEEYVECAKILDVKDKLSWNSKKPTPKKNHPWRTYGGQFIKENDLKRRHVI